MAHGRTYEGFDSQGVSTRYVIEQSERGYRLYSYHRQPFSQMWVPTRAPLNGHEDFDTSADARIAALKEIAEHELTTTEDWYTT